MRIEVGGVFAMARLNTADAPEAAASLERLLPMAGRALHAIWSGQAVSIALPGGWSRGSGEELAGPAIEPGTLAIPEGGREILIPYDTCMAYAATGPLGFTPVATLEGPTGPLFARIARLLDEGGAPFSVELVD